MSTPSSELTRIRKRNWLALAMIAAVGAELVLGVTAVALQIQ